MGLTHDRMLIEVESAIGQAVASSPPLRVGGQACDVQFMIPVGNLTRIEISNDRATWHTATDADGADIDGALAALALDDYREIRERPEWIRMVCDADGGGPRNFRALIGVHRLTG